MNIDERLERQLRNEQVLGTRGVPFKGFNKDRGFHSSDIHKAAEELRHEGKGSHDPVYGNSKKNK